MTRLRVLRVIARMNVGGPARQVTTLLQGLDPARFDHRLVTGRVGPEELDHLETQGLMDLPVVRLDGLGRAPHLAADVGAYRAIADLIRSFRPHIVHTHTAKAGALGRLAGRRAGVPVLVHTFHGHLLEGYFPRPVTAAITAVERGLARRTTALVAVGERVRDELLAAGVGRREQFTIVPPGIDVRTPPSRAEARGLLDLPPSASVVAFVGRLAPVKRPDRLIEVVDRVLAHRPETVFLVAGDGPERPMLEHHVARIGPDRLRLLGWRSDVEVLYAAADAVLLTSDNEGMPVSLIEAAMCGRPAVTTDVGSAREVVVHDETGYVTARDPGALADRLVALLGDDAAAVRMGAVARDRALGCFSGQRLVERTEALYEDLAKRAFGGDA